jgi:hypothetical protein
MPKPQRSMPEEMALSAEAIVNKFPHEYDLMNNINELYLETILKIEDLKSISNQKLPILILGTRNFRLIQSSNNALMCGFYDSSLVLLRQIYENNLLMQYLVQNENESEEWLKGKQFRPATLRKKINDNSGTYRFLSDMCTHANVECLFSGVFSKVEGDRVSITYFPEFNEPYARVSIQTQIMFSWMSLFWIHIAFEKQLLTPEYERQFTEYNIILMDFISGLQKTKN